MRFQRAEAAAACGMTRMSAAESSAATRAGGIAPVNATFGVACARAGASAETGVPPRIVNSTAGRSRAAASKVARPFSGSSEPA